MAFWDDAVDWVGGAWDTVTGGVDDTFAGETVKDPNRENFYLGGNAETAGNLRNQYGQSAQGARDFGAAAQGRQGPAGNYNQANLDYSDQRGARAAQMDGANRLTEFANRPQGPSAAQAQLQQGSDRAMAANLALANSGTGMGDSAEAMRRAQMANSTTLSETANNAAQLRAQEDQAYRQQQFNALGAAQDAYSGIRGADLGARGQSFQNTQFQTDADLQNRSLNDEMQRFAMGQAAGYDEMGYRTYQDELDAAQNYEQIRQGGAVANQASDAQRDGQLLGTASSMFGAAAMMSDQRAKKRIRELDDLNDTYAALSD